MNKTIRERFREFVESLLPVVKRYPVEMGLMVFTFICFALEREKICDEWVLMNNLLLIPVFFTLAYVSNTLTRRGGRMRYIYYFSWVVGLPLWILRIPALWVDSPEYWITVGVLCPLAVLLCRRAVDNRSFIGDVLAYFGAGLLSGIFSSIAFGLFLAIFYSVVYIFHILEGWTDGVFFYAATANYFLFQPLLFFAFLDRMLGREISGVKLLGFLLNWIVTPALLIYTAILYLYALKITVTWELPEGKVAFMVFGFTMLALVVKALRLAAWQPRCEWFFARFSLIALPPLALFWVGTLYRIGEYGLTEARVWLVICGLLMTFCIALFTTQRLGRYLYFCAMAFVVFAAVAYVPPLKPEKIALRSQATRVERIAGELGLVGATGKLLDRVGPVDTIEYKLYNQLYESLSYLYWKDDTVAMKRILGITDPEDLLSRLPDEAAYYARNGIARDAETWGEYDNSSYLYISSDEPVCMDIAGYKEICYGGMYYDGGVVDFGNDSLVLRMPGKLEWRISSAELLNRQLRKIGCPEGGCPTQETLEKCKSKLLNFEDSSLRIIFDNMSFNRNDRDSLIFDDATVRFVLLK